MVILQFNKLIRNKWVWGAFAILVGAAVCFGSLFTASGDNRQSTNSAGTLDGEEISREEFNANSEDLLGFGRARDYSRDTYETNLETWRRIATLRTAKRAGVIISDEVLSAYIKEWWMNSTRQSEFNFDSYTNSIAMFGTTPDRWGETLARDYTVRFVNNFLAGAGVFVSPMEIDVRFMDRTDTFEVRVARFTEDKEKAEAISVDEEGLKAWYEKNKTSIELPDRYKVRYVKIDLTDTNILAKAAVEIQQEELESRYDSNYDQYTSTDEEGNKVTKPLEEVKDEIEKEIRLEKTAKFYKDDLIVRAYKDIEEGEDPNVSRIDKIAAEEGLEVGESDWFAVEGSFVEGFMKSLNSIFPGVRRDNVAAIVKSLDPNDSEMSRYGVVSSENAVWLVERNDFDQSRIPSFEESRDKISGKALKDARADAFKAEVEAIAKQGIDAVLATDNVSTNIVFSRLDTQSGSFPNQSAVMNAAEKLTKGEVSGFVPTGTGNGLLVACIDRRQGPAYSGLREGIRMELMQKPLWYYTAKWSDANLERMNLKPELGFEIVPKSAEVDEDEYGEQ